MIINLTPHTINVNDGRSFPPSGQVARVTVSHLQVGMVDGIAIYQPTYGELVGLPDPVDGTVYLVSGQVAAAAKRADVVAPATGHGAAIRKDGQTVSVPGFSRG